MVVLLRDWLQNSTDRTNKILPTLRVRGQLFSTGGSQPVILRFSIVLRSAPEGSNPPTIFQTVQRGIKGSMFDLQHVLGAALNRMCDRVSMSRAEHQRL